MNINGIGAVGYPAAGYETRRAQRNTAGRNYTDQMCNMVQTTQMSSGTRQSAQFVGLIIPLQSTSRRNLILQTRCIK